MADETPRYIAELPADVGPFKKLLEQYSRIPPGEVEAHLYKVRDNAWAAAPYPCFGLWAFTRIGSFTSDPSYHLAVSRLTANGQESQQERLVDMGCGIGQNLRQLAHAGVAPSRLAGVDLHQELLDIGFEMFRDDDKMRGATFVAGDVLSGNGLEALEGTATMIHAANLFHLFSWEKQVEAGVRMASLLRPEASDALIFGRQIGSLEPGVRVGATTTRSEELFLNDQATFQRLWEEIGKATETSWKVDLEFLGAIPPGFEFLGEAARRCRFTVWRV